jgi:transcriptional regulator with XRE-family HTH domain
MSLLKMVGYRISELRIEKDITQKDLSLLCAIDRSNINKIENGKKNISMKTLEKIVINGLEITISEFFNHKFFYGTH